MKHFPVLVMLALLLPRAAPGQDIEAEAASTGESPPATPEWTDHNEHDPGAYERAKAGPGKRSPDQMMPAQAKVIGTPTAGKAGRPCHSDPDYPAIATVAPLSEGEVNFGDAERGQGRARAASGCAENGMRTTVGSGSIPEDGDPDRPVLTGRVANPGEQD